MGKDETLKSILLRSVEDALDILDGLIILNTVAHQVQGNPLFAQETFLPIDDDLRKAAIVL